MAALFLSQAMIILLTTPARRSCRLREAISAASRATGVMSHVPLIFRQHDPFSASAILRAVKSVCEMNCALPIKKKWCVAPLLTFVFPSPALNLVWGVMLPGICRTDPLNSSRLCPQGGRRYVPRSPFVRSYGTFHTCRTFAGLANPTISISSPP